MQEIKQGQEGCKTVRATEYQDGYDENTVRDIEGQVYRRTIAMRDIEGQVGRRTVYEHRMNICYIIEKTGQGGQDDNTVHATVQQTQCETHVVTKKN